MMLGGGIPPPPAQEQEEVNEEGRVLVGGTRPYGYSFSSSGSGSGSRSRSSSSSHGQPQPQGQLRNMRSASSVAPSESTVNITVTNQPHPPPTIDTTPSAPMNFAPMNRELSTIHEPISATSSHRTVPSGGSIPIPIPTTRDATTPVEGAHPSTFTSTATTTTTGQDSSSGPALSSAHASFVTPPATVEGQTSDESESVGGPASWEREESMGMRRGRPM